jgi:CII-binding regulator of phage lambda lysogenization HflD
MRRWKLVSLEDRLKRIEEVLDRLNERFDAINRELGELKGRQDTVVLILKYVVTPLLIILGALIGVKLAIPT